MRIEKRSRGRSIAMAKVAGWLITLCGVGHSVGAFLQAGPRYSGDWLSGALWDEQNQNLVEMTNVTAGFWFTWYSFGIPLILFGAAVLWQSRHAAVPPPFIAWALASWTIVGEVLSGPSPLLLLLVASGLLIGAHRATRPDEPTPHPMAHSGAGAH